jgi:hypothetical protein
MTCWTTMPTSRATGSIFSRLGELAIIWMRSGARHGYETGSNPQVASAFHVVFANFSCGVGKILLHLAAGVADRNSGGQTDCGTGVAADFFDSIDLPPGIMRKT